MTEPKQEIINSHIQPRHFLKGFLAAKTRPSEGDSVFVYKKGLPFKKYCRPEEWNPVKRVIGNTAIVENFYAFENDAGQIDPETYEKKLNEDIEQPAEPILEKLRTLPIPKNPTADIRISDLLHSEDRRKFARYVAGMFARSQTGREQFNNAVDLIARNVAIEGLSYKSISENIPVEAREKLEKYTDSINPDFDRSVDNLPMPPAYLNEFSDKKKKDDSFPKGIFWAIDVLEERFIKMKWQIRIVPRFPQFFTGDYPVVWTNLDEPDATLLFPISTTHLFCASINQSTSETISSEARSKFITTVNQVIAGNCNELYSHRESKRLCDFFNNQ